MLLYDMTPVTTTIMQPIVKEVCVNYPGYFSTIPSTFTCSHAQISDPPKKAKKETISCGYPAVWPWMDCCRPSLIRDPSGWNLKAMVEVLNAQHSPNLTNLPHIPLRCAPHPVKFISIVIHTWDYIHASDFRKANARQRSMRIDIL